MAEPTSAATPDPAARSEGAWCPLCGRPTVRLFRRPSTQDPDDPEPGAECLNPACDYYY